MKKRFGKIKYGSILLVVLVLLTSCASKLDGKLEEAEKMLEEGKIDEAEEIYIDLLEEKKAKDQASLKLGQLYLDKSDYKKAEEYLLNVEEESGQLASSLIILASDSNKINLLNKTFEYYKEKDFIKERQDFFENSIEAYAIRGESEKVEEAIKKVVEYKMELDPRIVEKAYSLFREKDKRDLAKAILKKDIYNRERGDLSLIEEILKMEIDIDREFINLSSGYYLSPDRLDLAFLYKIESEKEIDEVEILLINGLSGEVISTYKEEANNGHMKLEAFDTSGQSDHIISLWKDPEGSKSPSSLTFYDFDGEDLVKIDYEVESDRKISFKDNFEYEISSEKLDKNYLLQLNLDHVPYYLSQGFYNHEGKLLVLENDLGSGYENEYVHQNLAKEDYIYFSLELWDTYENKSDLGQIKSYYKLKDNKMILLDLVIEDGFGNPKPLDYKKVKGYKEIDFSDTSSKKQELEDYLKDHISLFKETKNSILKDYGKALVDNYYSGGRYFKYDDFIVFIDTSNPEEIVSAVWTSDLLGMENKTEAIIKRFGPPLYSGYDKEEMENYMAYGIDGYSVNFINIDGEHPYIKIKPI